MKSQVQIGGIYTRKTRNEIYIYLGNNKIYCCKSHNEKHVGRIFDDIEYEKWLRTECYRIEANDS